MKHALIALSGLVALGGCDLEALFLHYSGLDRAMLERLADAGLGT